MPVDRPYFLRYLVSIIIAGLLFLPFNSKADEHSATPHSSIVDTAHSSAGHDDGHGEVDPKDPVPIIMHHIMDANEFHIATMGDKHISIPLPVMIYNRSKGKMDVFLSSKVSHGHEYMGYHLVEGRVKSIAGDKIIDFSITKNVFSMLLSLLILGIILFSVKAAYTHRPGQAPRGLQGLIEPVILFIKEDIIIPNMGSKGVKYQIYLICLFFFILANNLIGLIPIFPFSANLSGNISFTVALGLISFFMINLNGNKHYWQHIFWMPGVPAVVKILVLTPVEILGVFLKPLVLMLRLFGNISGGHIAVLSIVSLIFILGDWGNNLIGAGVGSVFSLLILIFVNGLKLLVAFLQAYVFTLLTAIFMGIAMADDHAHETEHH